MDCNNREQFWKTLCSLQGKDIAVEREQLFKTIRYPKWLYQYRPVNMKSLEALRTNKLYFSSANYYDGSDFAENFDFSHFNQIFPIIRKIIELP